MTDERLLEQAVSGDETAFAVIYERHRGLVFRFAYRLSQSREMAEEITHDCFLSLIKEPQRFKTQEQRASLRTYLCAAARNLAFKRLRRAGAETAIDDFSEQLAVVVRNVLPGGAQGDEPYLGACADAPYDKTRRSSRPRCSEGNRDACRVQANRREKSQRGPGAHFPAPSNRPGGFSPRQRNQNHCQSWR
jgi:RNA polymerase sigma factor (sigma-70 family)